MSKPTPVSYLGRRAIVTQTKLANGTTQTDVTWIDDADERSGGWIAGTTTRRVTRGSALKGNLETLVEAHAI